MTATPQETLTALRDRIAASRTGANIALDQATLPTGLPAAGDQVLTRLRSILAPDATSLTIALTAEPVLGPSSLQLTGTASLLGCSNAAVLAEFTVDAALALQLTLAITPDDNWRLSDSFPNLASSPWDYLPLAGARLLFTTFAHSQPELPAALVPGINLAGTILVSPKLAVLSRYDAPTGNHAIAANGPITTGTAGTTLSLSTRDPVSEVVAALPGFTPLTVTNGLLEIHGAPNQPQPGRTDILRIAGQVTFGGTVRDCKVDLPTRYSGRVRLVIDLPPSEGLTLRDVVTVAGSPPLANLPSGIATLGIAASASFIFTFSPNGSEPSRAELNVSPQPLTLAPNIEIRDAHFDLVVIRPRPTDRWAAAVSAQISGVLAIGQMEVGVSAFVPRSGNWTLTIAPTPAPTLESLLSLAGLDASSTMAAFPQPLRPAAQIGLRDITISVDPDRRSVTQFNFTLAQTAAWPIGGVLEIRDGTLAVKVDVSPRRTRAVLTAKVRVGGEQSSLVLQATLPLPPEAGKRWEIGLAPGTNLALPGLSDIAALFGSESPQLPPNSGSVHTLTLDQFVLRFDPTASPVVRQVAFTVVQGAPWQMIAPNGPTISNFSGFFTFDVNPPNTFVGIDVQGRVSMCGVAVDAHLYRSAPADNWVLAVGFGEDAGIAGASGIDTWLNPGDIAGCLGPDAPLKGAARFGSLLVIFDGPSRSLKSVAFALRFNSPWTIITGKLAITQLSCRLKSTAPISLGSWTGEIRGVVTVLGADFLIVASRADRKHPWSFAGSLLTPITLDLVAAANSLSSGSALAFPRDIHNFGGFPSAITIAKASVETIPATGEFHLAGAATFKDWSFSLGGATLRIVGLGGEISVASSNAPVKARVYGSLDFASLQVDLSLQLGTDPATDTILAGVVSANRLGQLQLSEVANAVVGTGAWAGVPMSSDFVPPGFTGCAVYCNASKGTLMLHGRAARLGSATLLVRRLPSATSSTPASYGFALLISVEGTFRFADVLPASAPQALRAAFATLDAFISLEQVNLSLSSFDSDGDGREKTGNPFSDLSQIPPDDDAAKATPVIAKTARGLNVDGTLRLSGPLWDALHFIIEARAGLPILIHGTFDPKDPTQTKLQATLGAFSVLAGTLAFDSVDFTYQPNAKAPVVLACLGAVSIPGIGSGGSAQSQQQIRFRGDLTVTASTANAQLTAVTQDQAIRNPLGVPGLTISGLSLALVYAFATGKTGTSTGTLTRMAVQGQVTIGSVLALTCALEFTNSSPRIVRVTLDKKVPLSDLFAQCIGTQAYVSPLLPDLTLESGSLVYTSPDPKVSGSRSTFEIRADVRIFDHLLLLSADIITGDGVTGSATAATPFDLGFLLLAGPTGTSGPSVTVKALNNQKQFDLGFGFDLFGLQFRGGKLTYTAATKSSPETYTGELTFKGASTPLGMDATIAVEWTSAGGFKVTNWPALPQIPDLHLTDLIESINDGDICGALGALGVDRNFIKGACRTNFRLSNGPSVKHNGSTLPSAYIEADIRYELSVTLPGGKNVVLNPNSSPVTVKAQVTAPRQLTVADLLKVVVDAVVSGIQDLVKAVLRDPSALAQMTAALAVEKLSQHALDSLICRRTPDPRLRDELERRSENPDSEDPNDGDKQLDEAARQAAEAARAATAAAAAAAAESAYLAAGVAISFFGALLSSLLSLFGVETKEAKEAREKKERAEQLKQDAENAVRSKLAIGQVRLAITGANRVTASWPAVAGDHISYAVSATVSDDAGHVAVLHPGGLGPLGTQTATTSVLDDPAIIPGKHMATTITARYPRPGNNPPYYEGAPSQATTLIPNYLPRNLTLEEVESKILIKWTPGPQSPPNWLLTATAAGHPPAQLTVSGTATNAEFSPEKLTPGAKTTFTLTPSGTPYPVGGLTTSLVPASLRAPSPVRGFFTGSIVYANFSPVAGAAGYRAQMLSPAGGSVLADIAVDKSQVRAEFHELGALKVGQQVILRVATLGATDPAPQPVNWSAPVTFLLAALPTPVVTEIAYEPPQIVVRFQLVPGATGYEIELLNGSGLPEPSWTNLQKTFYLQPPPGSPPEEASRYPAVRFSGNGFSAPRQIATVRMYATNDVCSGAVLQPVLADPSPLRLNILEYNPPSRLLAENRGGLIYLEYSAAGTDAYYVTILDSTGKVLASQFSPIASATFSADRLPGHPAQISIRGKYGNNYSPAAMIAIPPSVADVTPPAGTKLLHFNGSSTKAVLKMTNIDQIRYRDSGHANNLVDLANSGFTIEAQIRPDLVDGDRPVVVLVYTRDSGVGAVQWKAGDITFGVFVTDGRISVKSFTMHWSAGTPSDARVATITAATPIATGRWTSVSVSCNSSVRIFLDGIPQLVTIADSNPEWEQYNRNAGGMSATLDVFCPDIHRFQFGVYKDRLFKGTMANIRIWRGPRPTADIMLDSNRRLVGAEVTAAEGKLLGGYWPLDDGAGTVARDLTTVSNDAILTDPTWPPT